MTISSLMKMPESPSKWVENTVGKGEIARYDQTRKNPGLFGKGLKTMKKKPFENTVGKSENAGNQQFLRFSASFYYHFQNKF